MPLTVSCSSKIQIGFTFLAPVHLGSPGQRAVTWMCVCVCVRVRPCMCTASTCYLLSHVTVTCMCSLYRVNGKMFALHQHTTLSHLMHTMTQCFITCTKQY